MEQLFVSEVVNLSLESESQQMLPSENTRKTPDYPVSGDKNSDNICLCVLCCYSYTPTSLQLPSSLSLADLGEECCIEKSDFVPPPSRISRNGAGASFIKFCTDIMAEKKGIKKESLLRLVESRPCSKLSSLSVCLDCLSLIESAMILKEQVDSGQGHVLSLQLQILQQLRELEELVVKYREGMRSIENVVKNADVSCLEMQIRLEQEEAMTRLNSDYAVVYNDEDEVTTMTGEYGFQAISDSSAEEDFGKNVFLLRNGIIEVCSSDYLSIRNIWGKSSTEDSLDDSGTMFDPMLKIKTEEELIEDNMHNANIDDDDDDQTEKMLSTEDNVDFGSSTMRRSKRLRNQTTSKPKPAHLRNLALSNSSKRARDHRERKDIQIDGIFSLSNPDTGCTIDQNHERPQLKGRLKQGRVKKRKLVNTYKPEGKAKGSKRYRGVYGWERVKKGLIIFRCVICPNYETFGRLKEPLFEHHLRQHETDEKHFFCELCPASFTHHQFSEFHRLSHYGFYKHCCDVCSALIQVPDLLDHIKAHKQVPDEQLIYCSNCSYVCTKRKSYIGHLVKHRVKLNNKAAIRGSAVTHTGVKFKCDLCPLQFSSKKDLIAHYTEVHRHQVEEEFICEELGCAKVFLRAVDLCAHRKRVHEKSQMYHECDQCGKRLKSLSALKEHSLLHTGEKPFGCSQCSERFPRKVSLEAHCIRAHGAEKYKCDKCGKEFSDRAYFKRHMNLHENKGHHCDQCGKILPSATMLKMHMQSHSDERHWTCDECGKSFKQKHSFKHHMNKHAGKKEWKCTYCEKAFTRKEFLTCHTRTHTGERPYVCDICGKDFNQSSALLVHKKNQHKQSTANTIPTVQSSHHAPNSCSSSFDAVGEIGAALTSTANIAENHASV